MPATTCDDRMTEAMQQRKFHSVQEDARKTDVEVEVRDNFSMNNFSEVVLKQAHCHVSNMLSLGLLVAILASERLSAMPLTSSCTLSDASAENFSNVMGSSKADSTEQAIS